MTVTALLVLLLVLLLIGALPVYPYSRLGLLPERHARGGRRGAGHDAADIDARA